jgi:predicted dehydrogenase
MNTRKYRVAVAGCGGMAKHHLRVLQVMDDFEAVALCDISAEALSRCGEEFSIAACFEDWSRLCDEVCPDIAVIATQTRGHLKPAVAALERGISVLCEKPIAIDPAEADAMVEAAQAGGAKLAINQQNHLNPGVLKALEMVGRGDIGEVVMVRGRNKCGRKSGNEFMEMGTHVTDMMMRFGGQPQWCAGTVHYQGRLAQRGDVMEAKQMSPKDRDSGPVAGDRAVAQYGFAGGVLGEIHFLGYEQLENTNYGVDVLGSEGQLAVRASGGLDPSLWHLPRPMEGIPGGGGDWRPVPAERTEDPIAAMYRGLAQAMETDSKPPGDGADGRTAFEMVLGIYASHIAGSARVPLPLPDRRHPLEVWRAG